MKKILLIIIITITCNYFYFKDSTNSWKIINAKPTGQTIVAFGDSLTAGYGVAKNDNYPSQLAILTNQPIINMGISGETTAEALARIDNVIAKNPKLVLITLGGNDLRIKLPASKAFSNLKQIVTILQQNGTLVVIGGIDIPFYSKDYADDYVVFAKENGCLLVPNILDGLFGHRDLMIDTVHPNAKGYKLVAASFYKAIKDYL